MFTAKPTIYATPQSLGTYASAWFNWSAARYYQNLVEQEQEAPGRYLATLHEWNAFSAVFTRLFGLHNEKLHAQSTLNQVRQQKDKSFADFVIKFEDTALKTGYNDDTLRWHLLNQIHFSLRS